MKTIKPHKIQQDNVGAFLNDLLTVLQKYDTYDTGPLTLNTANLNLNILDIKNCPQECRHVVESCHIDHQYCVISVECECPPKQL